MIYSGSWNSSVTWGSWTNGSGCLNDTLLLGAFFFQASFPCHIAPDCFSNNLLTLMFSSPILPGFFFGVLLFQLTAKHLHRAPRDAFLNTQIRCKILYLFSALESWPRLLTLSLRSCFSGPCLVLNHPHRPPQASPMPPRFFLPLPLAVSHQVDICLQTAPLCFLSTWPLDIICKNHIIALISIVTHHLNFLSFCTCWGLSPSFEYKFHRYGDSMSSCWIQ